MKIVNIWGWHRLNRRIQPEDHSEKPEKTDQVSKFREFGNINYKVEKLQKKYSKKLNHKLNVIIIFELSRFIL